MTEHNTVDVGLERKPRQVHVVLPAYNEARRIGKLLRRIDEDLREAGIAYRVLVLDDGSTDDTAAIVSHCARDMPVVLERHDKNQGLGAAIRDGLSLAAAGAADRDVIVTMDADDTHAPGLIVRMVRMVREGHDVVIASRYQPGARTIGVPWPRRLLSYGGSWLCRVLLPIPGVRDFTCGYRGYRAKVIKQALAEYGPRFVDQEGFQCMVDILFKLRNQRLVFGEVPLILRYDLKEGGTKMRVGATIVSTLGLLLRRRFGR
jgi:dolichol-phosphate mannosyltransferase